MLARLVEVAAVLDDLRAEAADRRDLHRVRALGHADTARTPKSRDGEGDRLAVVPGRGGDEPALALVRGELRDEVDPAAHLEVADRLVVLVLDPDLGADELVERRVAVERGLAEVGRDPLPRGEDVLEGRQCLTLQVGASGGSGGGR